MIGEKNAWRGGKGNDFILAAGKENAVKGNEDNDILFTLGQANKVEGGSGDDVMAVLGQTNDVDGGEGKDLMLVVGQKNKINCKAEDNTGDGNDTVLGNLGNDQIAGQLGDDTLLVLCNFGASEAAVAWQRFLLSAQSQVVWVRHGYALPQ